MGSEQSGTYGDAFSLVRGGLLYRLERRLGLLHDDQLGIKRRILLYICLTWLPIVVLEWVSDSSYPLYLDIGMHVRFLFSAPVLIFAETFIDRRIGLAISEFAKRGILEDRELSAAVSKMKRRIEGRAATIAELIFLIIILIAAIFAPQYSGPFSNWKEVSSESQLSAAMAWYLWAALPLLQFLQFRWLWRFISWAGFLWGAARARLNLFATHPDLMGGLGFITLAQEGFALILIAISANSATMVAFRVSTLEKSIERFYRPIVALVGMEAFVILAPLAFFVPQLIFLKLYGIANYGRLATGYMQKFEEKWVVKNSKDEDLLGTSDIQSFADIGNGFDRVRKMRIFPAERSFAGKIILAGLLPFLPLSFLTVPVNQIIQTAVRLLI